MAELDKIINYSLEKFGKKYNQSENDNSLIHNLFVREVFQIYKVYHPSRQKELKKYWYHKKNIRVKCDCGSTVRALSFRQHLETDKHINFMFNIELERTKQIK